jgi:mannose-6-phosphate isomerase-like protein (cupin superfamily)
VRRVVTEEVNGRSGILIDGPGPTTPFWDELWVTDPTDPLGREPGDAEMTLEPPTNGTGWRIYAVPPDTKMRQILDEAPADNGISDSDGYHKTKTVDYVYVLDGDITLELEDGSVDLHPGDCVVQRATNHAWRNASETPVRLLTVMLALS